MRDDDKTTHRCLKMLFRNLKKMLPKQNSVGPKLSSLFESFQFLSMLLKLNFLSHPAQHIGDKYVREGIKNLFKSN